MKRIKNKQIKYEKLQPSKVPREKEKKNEPRCSSKASYKVEDASVFEISLCECFTEEWKKEVSEGGQAGQAH